MKVLWFTNTPANGIEYFNSKLKGTGGWLKSLDEVLQDKVDLHIAFYYPHAFDPFKYKNATYYPITRGNFLLNIIKEKFINYVIDREDESLYLKLISEINPDIIHIHGTENPFSCIINKIQIPVVVSIQGNITIYEHKYFSGIERKYVRTRPKALFDPKKMIQGETFWHSYNRCKKMKDREIKNMLYCQFVIGRTDWDRRISRILAPKSKYFHNDEILRKQFYRHKWRPNNSDSKRIILHTTSENAFNKGFETICGALYELQKINIDVEWRVAGISNNDLIAKVVKKKLKTLYPLHGLVLLGRLDEYELIKLMLESDLYVLPSHIENSSNSLCEAMIIGMPCIATFSGGIGSLITDKKEGILIQDGDPWVMAGAIIELLKDKETAVRLGENARERAYKRHAPVTVIKELISIYKQIKRSNFQMTDIDNPSLTAKNNCK